jgi:hypothetical protein
MDGSFHVITDQLPEPLYTATKTQEVLIEITLDIGARIDFIKAYQNYTKSNVVLVAYRGYSNS